MFYKHAFLVFLQIELSHYFRHFSEWIEGTLCAQLLPQFNIDAFETLQMLSPCYEDMHVVGRLGYTPQIVFLSLFCNLNFSDIFTMKVRYLVCAHLLLQFHANSF